MSEDDQLIAELEIQHLAPEQQQRVLENLRLQIGEALVKDFDDAQLAEYQAIIDDDTETINKWLADNAPDYKASIAYQQLSEGYDGQPESVSPDKVYAYMAWVEKNSPGLAETVAQVKAEVKDNIDSYK